MDQRIKEISLENISDAWNIIDADAKWLNSQGLDHWITYYTKELLAEKHRHGKIFCVYEENIPVATVTLSQECPSYYNKVDLNKFTKVNNSLYISALAVHPEHHGNGYAKEILRFCEDYAKLNNINSLRFDARAKYTELIEFYKKRDYKIVGIMDDEGEDYALFEKSIS